MSGASSSRRRALMREIDSQYSPFRLKIRRSKIHGWGVFAALDIPRSRKVIEYTGERLNPSQTRIRVAKTQRLGKTKYTCLFNFNRHWTIDGAVGGSGAELINHTCDPNLKIRRIRGHLLLFSLRRIRKGQELGYDYHFDPKSTRVPCHCGSRKCRGTINLE